MARWNRRALGLLFLGLGVGKLLAGFAARLGMKEQAALLLTLAELAVGAGLTSRWWRRVAGWASGLAVLLLAGAVTLDLGTCGCFGVWGAATRNSRIVLGAGLLLSAVLVRAQASRVRDGEVEGGAA